MAAVIERDPEWSALPPTTPASILHVLRGCLDKDPARRLDDIAQVRIAIDETPGRAPLPAEGAEFLRYLVSGVLKNLAQLDAMIQRLAPAWPVSQIAIVDRKLRKAEFGHTPLTAAEKIPWRARRLWIGTGAHGALPVASDLREEARRRGVELLEKATPELVRLINRGLPAETNVILHVTC